MGKGKLREGRMVGKVTGKQSLLLLPLQSLNQPICFIMFIHVL